MCAALSLRATLQSMTYLLVWSTLRPAALIVAQGRRRGSCCILFFANADGGGGGLTITTSSMWDGRSGAAPGVLAFRRPALTRFGARYGGRLANAFTTSI